MGNIGNLVKIAKGEDRTLEQYSQASGISKAVISKLINESYIPKKADVYKALTSDQASPRGGITYQQMMEAVNQSKEYHDGFKAGRKQAEEILKASGSLSINAISGVANNISDAISLKSSKKRRGRKSAGEKLLEYMKKFYDASTRVITSQLAINGIAISKINTFSSGELKWIESIEVDHPSYDKCTFGYVINPEKAALDEAYYEKESRKILGNQVFSCRDERTLGIIVLNNDKLYQKVSEYKDKIAYRGNLMVLLMNIEDLCIEKEVLVAHYNLKDEKEEISFL